MKRLIVLICSMLCLLATLANARDPTGDHPQWEQLIGEAREAWNDGDFERGTDKLLLAVELAHGYRSPLALARYLERGGQRLVEAGDHDGAMRLLKEARSLREAEEGPRSAGVADTLLIMARVAKSRQAVADPGQEEDPKTDFEPALALYRDARDIRREVFGAGSCEAAEVEIEIGRLHEASGDSEKAERSYRDVIAFCPPIVTRGAEGEVGMTAEGALISLLWRDGRGEEAEAIIYSWPEEEPASAGHEASCEPTCEPATDVEPAPDLP